MLRHITRTSWVLAGLMAMALAPVVAQAGNHPCYSWNEARNPGGANRCTNNQQCDGARTCSAAGWCQGTAR